MKVFRMLMHAVVVSLLAPVALTFADTAQYSFTLENFQIKNTRSRHNDSDFVTFSLRVGGTQLATQKRSMGDLNNGTFPVNLTFNSVSVPQGALVVLNYQVVNSGHQDTSKIENTLDQTADHLIDIAATKFTSSTAASSSDGDQTATGMSETGQVIAKVFVSLAGYFLKFVAHAGVGMLFANCD